jgi:hypothetical protein
MRWKLVANMQGVLYYVTIYQYHQYFSTVLKYSGGTVLAYHSEGLQ